MLALLPFLCLVLFTLVIQKKLSPGWRVSVLMGSVFIGLIVTVFTEVFGALNLISYWSFFIVWSIFVTTIATILLLEKKPVFFGQIRLSIKSLSFIEIPFILYLIIAIIFIGVTAWVYPPNTWDSMTYHMSRVMHWIQNRNVDFFPTSNFRELHQNPWVEYAILHLQLLNQGDRFANFVQWFCLIGSTIGVTLIAKEFKASRLGQILAAVFCITIPMAILQGSSTQTDLAVSFWITCFVYFSIQLRKRPTFLISVTAGIALGLSILTKATAYIFAFPFLVWLVVSLVKNQFPKRLLHLTIIALLTLAINSGHYLRNYDLFGNPLGSGREVGGHTYKNDDISFSSLASNIIRNISLHLAITRNEQVNMILQNSINDIHEFLRISPNDARTTWQGTSFTITKLTRYEDTAGNPWHMIISVLLLLLLPFLKIKKRESIIYFFLIIIAFVLFCGYLKWQPWHSRLHLPLFILISPIVADVQNRTIFRTPVIILMLFFIYLSFPYLLQSKSRPLMGKNIINVIEHRSDEYFHNRLYLLSSYRGVAQELETLKCLNIGLIIGYDDYEYPLWSIIEPQVNEELIINHVNVDNLTASLPNSYGYQDMCAIFTIEPEAPNMVTASNKRYIKNWSSEGISVYRLID